MSSVLAGDPRCWIARALWSLSVLQNLKALRLRMHNDYPPVRWWGGLLVIALALVIWGITGLACIIITLAIVK